MKNLFYTILTICLLSSCSSINKMVERGDYESAIRLAQRKLQGDARKSTKKIKYLEEAFHKALRRDLDEVKFLSDKNRPENFDEIYAIYSDIKRRQDALRPLLPLVGKDGYKAKFKYLEIEGLLHVTSKKAAAYHYKVAKDFLSRAEAGDKWAARKAYDELDEVNVHYRHYEDVAELKHQALEIGQTRVLLRSENRSLVSMPVGFEEVMLAVDIKSLDDRWTKYYSTPPGQMDIDLVTEIEIREFAVSPEQEHVREYQEKQEVQDGFEYFYDSNGNVAKDTLGNDIKKPRMIWVFADVLEVRRTKAATVGGVIKFYDARTKELMKAENFSVESKFRDSTCSFRGDRRALTSNTRTRLRSNPRPFPTNESLALDAATKLKGVFASEIKRFVI